MKRLNFLVVLVGFSILIKVSFGQSSPDRSIFDKYFIDKTMRVDYIHTGDVKGEKFELAKIYPEGIWAGKTFQMIDPWQLGLYF